MGRHDLPVLLAIEEAAHRLGLRSDFGCENTHGTLDSSQTTPSERPAKYAVELNAGSAAASGVKVGDHLVVPTSADAALR